MSTTQIVTLACYDLRLKYLQDLDYKRLLLRSGFNGNTPKSRKQLQDDGHFCGMHHSGQGCSSPFKGKFVGARFVHIGLRALLPELHLQLILANVFLQQDVVSEYQNISHVLKYSDLKLGDGHQLIIKIDTQT